MKGLMVATTLLILTQGCTQFAHPATWRVLFDGHDTKAWRGYTRTEFPTSGWIVEDNCLHLLPGGKGGQLVTVEKFDNFELEWEWRIAPKANNGIKYFVTESRPTAPGHEYQMVDDTTERGEKHLTASFYDVLAPQMTPRPNPPGQWNHSRLVVRGNHVEHWLNGVKVLTYELGSPELRAALAQSKFRNVPGFGEKLKGHILLTNHSGETWFRKMRIRELPEK